MPNPASQSRAPLSVGQVLEIAFPAFAPQITIHSKSERTADIRVEVKANP
jgi:hypothetical protein